MSPFSCTLVLLLRARGYENDGGCIGRWELGGMLPPPPLSTPLGLRFLAAAGFRSRTHPERTPNTSRMDSEWIPNRPPAVGRVRKRPGTKMIVKAALRHNGVPHICFNLFFELSSGSRSLEEYGSLAFFILFFVSGICGNLAFLYPELTNVILNYMELMLTFWHTFRSKKSC